MKKLRHAIWFLFALLFSMNLLALGNIAALAQEEEGPIPPIPGPYPGPITGFPPPEQQAGVVVVASIGGNTNPEPGTYYYPSGTIITLTATPWIGFTFERWVITGQFTPGHNIPPVILPPVTEDGEVQPTPPVGPVTSDYDSLVVVQNPLKIQCGYGYTYQYQAVFAPTSQTTSAGAILIMLGSVGGTTNPPAGTYTYTSDQEISLQATPGSGYEFKQWVISQSAMPGHGVLEWDKVVYTTNPLATHTPIGYRYTYQAVFTPTGTTTPSGIAVETFYIVIAVLVIAIIIVAAVAVYAMRRRTK